MAQLSNDCFTHSGRLMRVEEARTLLDQVVSQISETESVPLDLALGRILLEDVVAEFDVPPHDNSAVDGYAVFFDDLDPEAETILPVTGRIAAGHPLERPARRGEAVRIFTGAPMPNGLDRDGPDTVMMQEDCRLEGELVALAPGINQGANRRGRGEDFAAGDTVLRRGMRLRPQDLGQAAATGRRELVVARPLRAALFSTGDELREAGAPLTPGTIYDSNRATIHGLLSALGCAVTDLGILPDRLDSIRTALDDAARGHDFIVTSGGVSVGDEDHVKTAVEALGKLHLWRLAIKPGRPLALGQVGTVPFIGLPGNPVAVMVTFLNVVRPMILRLMGADVPAPRRFQVRADFSHKKKDGRREWLRVRLEGGGPEAWRAVAFPRAGAGILSSMVEADGLVELPEDLTQLEPGTMVDYLPFSEVYP